MCVVSPAERKAVAQGAGPGPASAGCSCSPIYGTAGKAPAPGSPARRGGWNFCQPENSYGPCMAGRDVNAAFEEDFHRPNKGAWVLSPSTK